MNGDPLRCDATIDVEAHDWDQFVCLGVYDGASFQIYEDPYDAWHATAKLRGDVWAHWGGKYDFLWWLDMARREGLQVSAHMVRDRITRIPVRGGPVLRDSASLISMPLKHSRRGEPVARQLIDREDLPPATPCICFEPGCDGACSLGLPRYRRQRLERCEYDCRLTYDVITEVITRLAREGLDVRGTYAATGWHTARRIENIPKASWPDWQTYNRAKRGLYGGRCEIGVPKAGSGVGYDMTAAYPSEMIEAELPVGEFRVVPGDVAQRCFDRGNPGIYHARVNVRRTFWPPLPWRRRDRRVFWPIGRFAGHWWDGELRYAMDHGAQVEQFVGAIVWGETARCLRRSTIELWNRRARERNPAWRRLYKDIMNGVAGWCSMRPEGWRLRLHPDRDKIRVCPGKGHCTPKRCSGKCRRWISLSWPPGPVWQEPYAVIPDYAYPQWGAAIHAGIRCKLHAAISGGGGGKILYLDTDGIKAAGERHGIEVGNGIGQWKYEGQIYDFLALGPKLLSYRDEDGRRHVRSRGLRKVSSPEQWERYASGQQLELPGGVKSVMAAARAGGPLFAKGSRFILGAGVARELDVEGARIGGRVYDSNAGITIPCDVQEVNSWME